MPDAVPRLTNLWIGICIVFSSGLACGETLAPITNENLDRFGTIYHTFNPVAADPSYCQSACVADAQCQTWTYHRPEHTDDHCPICFLKDQLRPLRIDAPGAMSGIVRPGPPLAPSAPDGSHGLAFGTERRLEVMPILFILSDNTSISTQDIGEISDLLYAHLVLAQKRWKSLLETDTFKISAGTLPVYRAKQPDSFYTGQMNMAGGKPSSPDFMLKEILDWRHDDRNLSKYIYAVVYARSAGTRVPAQFFGAGRTMNGRPNTGGGVTELELAALFTDTPFRFQATIIHELGHTFGLPHPDCHGYDLKANDSPMSYNPNQATDGLMEASAPIKLNPEEFFVLSQNKLAFPRFRYIVEKHNPQRKNLERVENCYFGPMNPYSGALRK